MECPHCKIGFHDEKTIYGVAKEGFKSYYVISRICPVCKEIIVELAWSGRRSRWISQ